MNEKEFTTAEIYQKMIAEKLSFPEMAAKLVKTSHQGLRYQIEKHCKAFNKPMPTGAKRGRKAKVKTFKIKE